MSDFFSGFAEGFLKTSANTVLRQRQYDEEADAARKRAIALIDPQVEVDRRREEVQRESKQIQREENYKRFNSMLGKTDPSTPASVPEGVDPTTVAAPASTSEPEDINSVFDNMQKFTKLQSEALASGDREMADFANVQVDLYKQKMDFLKSTAAQSAKPVVGAEGGNIVELIQKDNEALIKNKTAVSPYFPTALNSLVNDPSVTPKHKKLNEEHQALAQAIAGAKREALSSNTPEVSSTISAKTGEVIKNINTLMIEDPRITPEMKAKAASDILAYGETMSPIEQQRIMSDPNYKAVFTPEVNEAIAKYSSDTPATDTTAKPSAAKPNKPKAKDVRSDPRAAQIRADYKARKISKQEALQQLRALAN